jgi:hypothetical protein
MVKLSAVAGGIAAAGGGVGWTYREHLAQHHNAYIETFIRRNFEYLKLDVTSKEMRSFIALYRGHCSPIYTALVHGCAERLSVRPPGGYERQMDELCTTFLMSTDFFPRGADESLPVRYVTLFHPYLSPCWNPLRRQG